MSRTTPHELPNIWIQLMSTGISSIALAFRLCS